MPPDGGAGHTTSPTWGVHKPAVKLLRNKNQIKLNQSISYRDLHRFIFNHLYQTISASLQTSLRPTDFAIVQCCVSKDHPPPTSLPICPQLHATKSENVPAKSRPTSAHHLATACRAPDDHDSTSQGPPSDSFQGGILHLGHCVQRGDRRHPCLRHSTIFIFMKFISTNL